MLQRLSYDKEARRHVVACSRTDIRYWVDNFVWSYDPRLRGDPYIPFLLFPKQVEFLRWLNERTVNDEDGLVEKSRDAGATWLCIIFAVHSWLYDPGCKIIFASRKEVLVDKMGDPDSIFEKIRILLRRLPTWMLPAGFRWDLHDNHMKLINPETGATITGEAGNNIGRGGRASLVFIDEAAFIERPATVDAALSQTTFCRIYVSTPNGNGNPFYQKRHSGHTPVFTIHWKDDPRKNRWVVSDANGQILERGQGRRSESLPKGHRLSYPWYDRECIRIQDPVQIAQELDIDYTASIAGICIPSIWVKAAVDFDTEVEELPKGERVAGFDVADGGTAENVLLIRDGPVIPDQGIHAWQGDSYDAALEAKNIAESYKVARVFYDANGPGLSVRDRWERGDAKPAFEVVAVSGGSTPSNRVWPDGKRSAQKFLNLRAELWWTLRTRFERTYHYRYSGVDCPLDDLISIPNDPKLIAQLSSVKAFETETGKIQLERKDQMASRGVASPDRGDSLAYSFAPAPEKKRRQTSTASSML